MAGTPLPAGDFEFLFVDDSGVGVLLNSDVSPTQGFVDINEVTGLDNPTFRETFRDHEGADGGFLDAEFEKGRDVLLTGVAYAPTNLMEKYLDELKENFAPRTASNRLYFYTPGVGLRFLNCKSRGMRYDWDSMRRTGTARVQFGLYAEDPRIYSYPVLTGSKGWSAAPSGAQFGFNHGFDFGFGVSSSALLYDQIQIWNDGNRPAPANLYISGPGVNPRILNDTNGGELLFNLTLVAGQVLIIDLVNRTVNIANSLTMPTPASVPRVNRRNALAVDDWFLLEPGANILRFQLAGGGGNPGQTIMLVEWSGAWR